MPTKITGITIRYTHFVQQAVCSYISMYVIL